MQINVVPNQTQTNSQQVVLTLPLPTKLDTQYFAEPKSFESNNNSSKEITMSRSNQVLNNRKRKKQPNEEEFDEDTTESNDGSDMNISSKEQKPKPKKNKWSTFVTRFFVTWGLIGAFITLLFLGHYVVAILVAVLQTVAFREISLLGAKPRIEQKLPNDYLLHWYFFLTSIFFFYGHTLIEHLLLNNWIWTISLVSSIFQFLFRYHGLLSFSMICLGLVSFVLSLKKGYYKYQFKQLGWCLVIIVIIMGLSTFGIANILNGYIWFIVPAFCIITNDVMAYMCGITFGKTPLIQLSPNKTWEGAIGAGFFTIIIAFLMSKYLIDYQFLTCPKRDSALFFSHPACHTDSVFLRQEYGFPETIQIILNNIGISKYYMNGWIIAPFQFHALVFAAFASIVGPFGGFFASGLKRALGVKDFGDVFPGHGGVTDRFDCQILMCAFVYVYRKAFIRSMTISATTLLEFAMMLPLEEQKNLLNGLQGAIQNGV